MGKKFLLEGIIPLREKSCNKAHKQKIFNLSLAIAFICFAYIVLPKAVAFGQSSTANSSSDDIKTTIGEYFDGEEFTYSISFLWFEKAATGKIAIQKRGDNTYEITLIAETMGFIGFITGYRKDIYHAYAEEIDGGKRFRTKRFEKIVKIGRRTRYGYTVVDYNKRTYHWKSWGGGKEDKEDEKVIPEGVLYDDPLTGFYNFRFGVYGPIDQGKEFHVPTFPVKDVSTIYVRVAPHAEKTIRLNPPQSPVVYLADVVVHKELFGSQTGNIEVHFTKELIPVTAIAKDLILFGDVKGALMEMTSTMGFKNTGSRTWK